MQITKVEKQLKNEKRYSIFIDDEFAFGLSEVDVLYYKLKENEEISEKKYENILQNVVFSQARDKAIRYLSYKARTKAEVIKRLKKEEFSDEVITEVIELMVKYNYIDDMKYAKTCMEYMANKKKYGISRIKFELQQKGVEKDVINELLNGADFDETESAILLLEKKTRGNKEFDGKEKQRVYNFLLRRGFSTNIIKKAFETYMGE